MARKGTQRRKGQKPKEKIRKARDVRRSNALSLAAKKAWRTRRKRYGKDGVKG